MACQERNIFLALSERRNLNWKDVQAVKKVLAKATGGNGLLQIAVGGANDANVGVPRAIIADTLIFFLLQKAQQVALHVQRELADFVQKQRALFRGLDPTGPIFDGPGKGTAHVSE